jgi:hypothetical protein
LLFVTAAAPQELGRVHFQTSCTPQAQQKFDRGLAMVHSFVYPDSVATFTELLRPILECAIAYRRIAISHRPLVTLIFGFGVLVEEVQARDFGQYASSSAEQRKWFKDLAPPGRNLGVWSCCDQGDVVRTKFRVNIKNGDDEWMYLASDGTWKVVPPDVILWDKINDPMNDGQARLWVSPYLKEPDGTPKPICFIPPRSGN